MNAAFPANSTTLVQESITKPSAITIPSTIYAVVLSSLLIVWSIVWDIMWHMSIGRDGLFSPPHVVMYVGAIIAGSFAGYTILARTFKANHPDRIQSVRFWGVFYGSTGALFCVWGAVAILTSAPFDNWWHSAYGLDVQILSPPHALGLLGMTLLQFGALVSVLTLRNQLKGKNVTEALQKRLELLFIVSAGFLMTMIYILFYEKFMDGQGHRSQYYILASLFLPVYMMAIGRTSASSYPMTKLATIYMLTILVPSWILQFLPATPRLGPVLNDVTHYQPFQFPFLLIIPAWVLDKILQRYPKHWNDWQLAGLVAILFLVTFTAVQWPFSEFMLTSAWSRNYFFMSYTWPFNAPADYPYRYQFNPGLHENAIQLVRGWAIALVAAFLSARTGLWIGAWMKNIYR